MDFLILSFLAWASTASFRLLLVVLDGGGGLSIREDVYRRGPAFKASRDCIFPPKQHEISEEMPACHQSLAKAVTGGSCNNQFNMA